MYEHILFSHTLDVGQNNFIFLSLFSLKFDFIYPYIFAVSSVVNILKDDILKHLSDSRCGERLREGLSVVIAGEPNVGKSSLLNSICKDLHVVNNFSNLFRDGYYQ